MTDLQSLLDRVVRMLDEAGIPFMIAGSFASTVHGLPRTTQDLDTVIDPPDAASFDALVGAISPGEYYVDADTARDALRRRSMLEWSHDSGGSERQRRDVAGVSPRWATGWTAPTSSAG
jgi:hypothetical protein